MGGAVGHCMTVAPPGVNGLPGPSGMTVFCVVSFHPTNGGKQIKNDNTHTAAMSILARLFDIILGYVTGLVTATYLSKEIAQRLSIDAVHIQTSNASHAEHQKSPNIQTWKKKKQKSLELINLFVNYIQIFGAVEELSRAPVKEDRVDESQVNKTGVLGAL